jgi:putrescine transport system substrate-binding protein
MSAFLFRPSRIAFALLATFFAAEGARAEDKVLNLYIWSDYLAPHTIDKFTQETGIKVNVDNFDSSEMLEAKMLAGGSGYDVVVPNGPVLGRFIKAGILQPLNKTKLTNIATQDPAIVSRAATQDPGNTHAVVYMWGTSGLGYNVKKVKQILGPKAPVDSWSLILDPANAQKLSECGIYAFDSPADIFELTLSYLGKPANSTQPADFETAAALWRNVRPHITKFDNSEYITALANGDVCVAMGYSGDVFQAAERATEAKNGVEIAYSIPKEGAIMWFDFLAIPKDAPHVDNAHTFLNFILRPEIVAAISNEVYYANPNLKARPFMNKELLDDPNVYPPPSVASKLLNETIPTPEIERLRTRLWTRVKTGS